MKCVLYFLLSLVIWSVAVQATWEFDGCIDEDIAFIKEEMAAVKTRVESKLHSFLSWYIHC